MQDTHEVVSHRERQDPWGNNPTEESANEPVGFPSPVLHPAVGNVEAGEGETTEPVKKHPQCWVHGILAYEFTGERLLLTVASHGRAELHLAE